MKKSIYKQIICAFLVLHAYLSIAQNIVPGSFGGQITVSPTGAAVYSIPIDLPEGRGGMTPRISLVYNSQSGSGVVGKGWSISGWSYIGRVAETIYYNGTPGSIDFQDDSFEIDGNNILLVNQSNNEYRKELNDGTKITFVHSTQRESSSSYWKVQTKEGYTMYYGKSSQSRQSNGAGTLAIRWHLNRIEDISGNFIEFEYDNIQTTGEVYLSKINYSKNKNAEADNNTYYSVLFNYSPLTNSKTHSTIYFTHLKSSYEYNVKKRLSNINISIGGTTVSDYNLHYKEGLFGDFYLESISLKSGNSSILPIQFEWKTNQGIVNVNNNLIENYTCGDYLRSSITGDFNGDGLSDVVLTDIQNNNAHIYLSRKGMNSILFSFIGMNINGQKFVGDINGDGIDEIIIESGHTTEKANIIRFQKETQSMIVEGEIMEKPLYFGDFDGDGRTDLITSIDEKYYIRFGQDSYTSFINERKSLSIPNIKILWQGNFIGSSKTGLVGMEGDKLSHFIISSISLNDYSAENTHSIELPPNTQFVNIGDFNGDGKDDIIYGKDGKTYICYSYGMGFKKEVVMSGIDDTWWHTSKVFSFADVNGDGQCDIIMADKIQSKMASNIRFNYNVYFKYPGVYTGFNKQERFLNVPINTISPIYSYKFEIHDLLFGNFHGLGINDIFIHTEIDAFDANLIRVYYGGLGTHSYYSEVNDSRIIRISDGVFRSTILDYAATWPNEVAPQPFIKYPLRIYRYPITVLSKVSNSDVFISSSPIPLLSYLWWNFITHSTGKGALGFGSVQEYDFSTNNNKTSITGIGNVNNQFFHPYIDTIYIFNGMRLLSSTKNICKIKQTHSNDAPKVFIPIITMSCTKEWDLDGSYKGIEMIKQDLWNVDNYGNIRMREVLRDEWKTSMHQTNWNWQTQYWSIYNHIADDERWQSRLDRSIIKAKSYELEDWKFESTENTYNSKGQIESISSISGYDIFDNELVSRRNFEYDLYGNTVRIISSAPNSKELLPREIELEFGTKFSGRFLTKKIVKGVNDFITEYDYFPERGLLKEKKEMCDPLSGDSKIVTIYDYDEFGRLKSTLHSDNNQSLIELVMNPGGDDSPINSVFRSKTYTVTSDDQVWNTITKYYDEYYNEVRVVSSDLNSNAIYVDKKYDNYNRLIFETEPYYADSKQGLTSTYDYDVMGRLIATTQPDGTVIRTTYQGRSTTVKNLSSNVWNQLTVNSLGLVDLVKDTLTKLNPLHLVNNNYDGLGRLISTVSFGNIARFEYDAAGNQSKLIDPNAGSSEFTYNAFGEQVTLKDARGNIYQVDYDLSGRILSRMLVSSGEDVVTYKYYNTIGENGYGLLEEIERSNGVKTTYTYDNLGRLSTKAYHIDGIVYNFASTYNSKTGMLETYEFPSGFKLKYAFNNVGRQNRIYNALNDDLLWEANSENHLGQLISVTLGNGTIEENGWSALGYPVSKKVTSGTDVLQNLYYSYSTVTGNMNWRYDSRRSLLELFGYDNLLKNRLIQWNIGGGGSIRTAEYHANGNILSKSDVTSLAKGYLYESDKPNAVTSVKGPTLDFLSISDQQNVTYTAFDKIESITKDDISPTTLSFIYGPNNERIKTIYYENDNQEYPIETKLYLDNYEIINNTIGDKSKQFHFLNGPDGIFGIYVLEEVGSFFYIHKDILGSISTISDESGNEVESLSYDPWGRRRNPNDWADYRVTSTMFDRGFTGHEHLDEFGLINMNGRVYDPYLARFLSPDPFVQAPENGQSYNRYSYCLNNPLKYTDPTGEYWHLVIGAAVGGLANWTANGAEFSWRGLGFFGVGAAAGFLGSGIGAGLGTWASGAGTFGFSSYTGLTATTGFGTGFFSGFGGAFTHGMVSGTGNGLLMGRDINRSLESGLRTGMYDGLYGGFGNGLISGYRGLSLGMDFWTGTGTAGKFGKLPSLATADINNKNLPSSLNTSGLRRFHHDLIEPEFRLKPGIHGKIPGYGFEEINFSAAKGVSVIGPRSTYREFAKKIGANFLDVTDEAWSMRKNVEFLQGVVRRGDDVIFSGKFNPAKLDPKSVLGQEIRYLQRHGYSWTDDFSRMIKK